MTGRPRRAKPAAHGSSRQNHYVPEWYQAGFGADGAYNWFVDISTPKTRPDGSPILAVPRQRAPKACFWEQDLYVTRFGDQFNDQVETVLFRGIDDFGAKAVRAFVQGDTAAMHSQHEALFAYLGAQKLRTPKGLDWIRSRYPALSQIELMIELQHLRQMFGALWAESVREIVSAEDAAVKFIVTDHPVTTFNAALPVGAWLQSDPRDAPITWNGTQTLFALDANHCLILTHVPFAKDPTAVEPVDKRINARHFGNALMRTDTLIRTRRLGTDEVIAINGWLKSRARRFIAAGHPDWLYPERLQAVDPPLLAHILRPPDDELWHYGGEVYIGYQDGSSGYYDQYGRTSKEHEFVAKAVPDAPPTPEQPCPCGSDETYAKCCQSRTPWERPPWNVWSLRERNLGFIRALASVLELNDDTPWTEIQRGLSDAQVSRVHRIAQGLWPEGSDLAELLPRPTPGRTRAVYMGSSDPRTMAASVISLVPLFDQVLVMDPFVNPRYIRPEYNPVIAPTQYKLQFLKNAMFWLSLAPLIAAGNVVLFPNPADLDFAFHSAMHAMAMERTADWVMDTQDLEEFRGLGRDDFQRTLLLLPDATLKSLFRKSTPDVPDDTLDGVIATMRELGEADPLALLQVLPLGPDGGQILALRCVTLEVALFVAQTTGAVIVTDLHALWEHLHRHTHAARVPDGAAPGPTLGFRAPLHPEDALAIAATPQAAAVRARIIALQACTDAHAPAHIPLAALEQDLGALAQRVSGQIPV
ncbi:MAG: SEC-C metal-binding domain-containing protein, partial [Arenimonas sp.]